MNDFTKIDHLSLKTLSLDTQITEYCDMNTRIVEFERLWVATMFPPPMPLQRSTNIYEVLSDEDRERWAASTYGEREAIEQEHRIKNGLDIPTPVPYYECDDDDDLRWIE
jgi:hypothetical protein